MLTDKRDNLEH